MSWSIDMYQCKCANKLRRWHSLFVWVGVGNRWWIGGATTWLNMKEVNSRSTLQGQVLGVLKHPPPLQFWFTGRAVAIYQL